MKLTKFFTGTCIYIFYVALLNVGIFAIDPNTTFEAIFMFIWLIICVMVLPVITVIKVEKIQNKYLDKIKEEERIKGAKMFLDQISDTERFKEVTNQTLPLINAKGEKYGTTTVYGDLSGFLDTKFKA